ncbi:hypothetical protein MJO28_013755 [Puccinia striiformis f. sp. tritici]|uniref:TRIP4/RQT4 C2HC5-type zinc finger domain-containing protein n=2 Tax=Puccinia striiformis TaxID=27350 RepID=A0A2S4UH58_9BASI|nr:hypothetical protein MJO28_013755 [Puccinia striiformis f. sp. tritici]POV96484.1 hypothetical protein PSTT_15623 [Puccinia striiformis]
MDDKLSCEALMEFTGLDQESTMTQILPYLKSMKTRAEVEDYLGSLIGQGQKQTGFIQRFSEQRFRKASATVQSLRKDDSGFPSLQSTQKSSASNLPTTSNLSNAPIKTRGGPSIKNTGQSSQNNPPPIDPKIYNNFGNSANVYMKSRDAEESAAKSSKKKNTKSTLSGTVTPEPRLESTSNPDKSKPLEDPVTTANSKPDIPPDIDIPISELSSSTLKELLELKVILDGFESKTSTPRGTAQCFCEARSHGLPIGRLPKQCAKCGLIYCRLKPVLSFCPSCNEPTPFSNNDDLKKNVCAEFLAKRNGLIKLEIEKYQRKISLELKKAQVQEADRAYPSLPTTSNTNKAHSHQQQAANNATYSNQLHPGMSIQNRIRLGYERLAEEHSGKSSDQQSLQQQRSNHLSSNNSHTVLRLNSSNGKTKIIKTTRKNLKDSTPQQQEHLTFKQAFDPEFYGIDHDDLNNPPYLDPFDDLSNLSSNLQPSLFVTEKLSSLHNTVPDYVPVDAHQV